KRLDGVDPPLELVEGGQPMREQRTAIECRHDAAARAIKQPHTERMLQARNRARHDRLRDGKMLSGFRHASSLHRRKQNVHVLQLEPAANAILPLHLRSIAIWTYSQRKTEFDCYRNGGQAATGDLIQSFLGSDVDDG